MALVFDDSNNEYLDGGILATTANGPLSFACWFKTNDLTIDQMLMCYGASGSTHHFALYIAGTVASDPLRAQTIGSGGTITASRTSISANTWHFGGAVFGSDEIATTVYLDSSSAKGATVIASNNVIGIDTFRIGQEANSTGGSYLSGTVAEAAIWTTDLTTFEMASLADGACPRLIRPGSLAHYWPFITRDTTPINLFGDIGLTYNGTAGTPVKGVDHCRIYY